MRTSVAVRERRFSVSSTQPTVAAAQARTLSPVSGAETLASCQTPRHRLPARDSRSDVRAALVNAGFTTERIESALGVAEPTAPAEEAVHRRRLAHDDAFSTVARLFLLGEVIPPGSVEDAFAPVSLAAW